MTQNIEYVRVRWAGTIVSATVVQRFKNGKIKVELSGRYVGGRPGSSSKSERFTVEPWQIVADDPSSGAT